MGTARLFNRLVKSELNIHAAWVPVINTFKLGDYGLISGGVLVKAGNISEFGISFKHVKSPAMRFIFTSKSVSITRTVAGAKVTAFPDQNIDARLSVEFGEENAFFLRGGTLALDEMQNVRQVAEALAVAPSWRTTYRVISGIYIAERCVILSSKNAGAKCQLEASASVLKQLDAGSVDAGVDLTSSEQLGLDIAGNGGVVGLGLFKLTLITMNMRPMGGITGSSGRPEIPSPSHSAAGFETHITWPVDLEDDI
jgi:hypothetical protein